MKKLTLALLFLLAAVSVLPAQDDVKGKIDPDEYIIYSAAASYKLEHTAVSSGYTAEFSIPVKTSGLLEDIDKRKFAGKQILAAKATAEGLVGSTPEEMKKIGEVIGPKLPEAELALAIKGYKDLKNETLEAFLSKAKKQSDLSRDRMFFVKYAALNGAFPAEEELKRQGALQKVNEDFSMKYRKARNMGELAMSSPGFSKDRGQAMLLVESKVERSATILFVEAIDGKWSVVFTYALEFPKKK